MRARGSIGRKRAFALLLLSFPSTADAQVGAAVSIFSDDRFRGYSLSEGRPVAILDLSYDAPSGLYAGGSASAVAARGGIRPLGLQVNGGYAARLRPGVTFDLGAIHSEYSRLSGLGGSRSYTEVYAGLAGRWLSSRLSVSPDYFGQSWALHGEVGAHFSLAREVRLDADLGLLVPMSSGRYGRYARPVYDARLGISRSVGRLSLHAAVTTRGADRDLYLRRRSSRTAVVVGISTAL